MKPWLDGRPRAGQLPPAWTFVRKRRTVFDVTLRNHVEQLTMIVQVRALSMAHASGLALREFDEARQCTVSSVAVAPRRRTA